MNKRSHTEPLLFRDDPLWYKNAIIYELHIRAFSDSQGDGVGDFLGLTEKLDYLEDLGVTALWLLPFYPSPLKDDGYDISAELRDDDDRIEITGDADAIADVEAFMARKDGGLKSNKDAYIKEAAGDFGTAVTQVENIAAWIEANTDVKRALQNLDPKLWPDTRDAINEYAEGLADRLMAGR